MFLVFIVLNFKLHSIHELKKAEREGYFKQTTTKSDNDVEKIIKASAQTCGTYGKSGELSELKNSEDWIYLDDESLNYYTECSTSGGSLTLSGGNLIRISSHSGPRPAIYLNNANLDCTLDLCWLVLPRSDTGSVFKLEGTGNHAIKGTKFYACSPINAGQNSAVIYANGASQNVFSSITISTDTYQNWEDENFATLANYSRGIKIGTGASLELSNSTFIKLMTVEYGGGIYIGSHSGVNIDNCVFQNCVGSKNSEPNKVHGIYINSQANAADIVINQCTFTDNGVFEKDGGTQIFQGSVIWIDGNNCEITRSVFNFTESDKTCRAIKVVRRGKFTINNNFFYNSSANYNGQGILLQGEVYSTWTEDIQVIGNTFENMNANISGRAIHATFQTDSYIVKGNIFRNNQKSNYSLVYINPNDSSSINDTLILTSMTFSNVDINTFMNIGDATFNSVIFEECIFENYANEIQFSYSSALFNKCQFINCGGSDRSALYLGESNQGWTFQNCFFNQNPTPAIYIQNANSNVLFENCSFSGNSGSHAVNIQESSNVEFISGTFRDNSQCINIYSKANSLNVQNVIFENTDHSMNSAGIRIEKKSIVNIEDCSFTKCKNNAGSCIYYRALSGADEEIDESITISSCKFSNNKLMGQQSGAAFYLFPKASIPTVRDCIFNDNNEVQYIFCITFDYSSDVIENINIIFSNLTFENNYNTHQYGGGSGFWVGRNQNDQENGMINALYDSCRFQGNHAGQGGGISFSSSTTKPINFTFINCNFTDNYCNTLGGACNFETKSGVTLENCNFVNNRATQSGQGGAISFGSEVAKISIYQCKFQNCQSDKGAGISIKSPGEISILNSEFLSNKANIQGGAITLISSGTVFIDKCTFRNNVAFSEKDENVNSTNLKLLEDDNEQLGGAIYIQGSNAQVITITESQFDNNQADHDAHAVFSSGNCQIITDNCSFNNNFNNGNGAEITLSNTYTEIKNSNIYKEQDSLVRGIHLMQEAELYINNCHFYDLNIVDEGNAILIDNGANKVTIESVNFTNCGSGFAIICHGANFELNISTFIYEESSGNCLLMDNPGILQLNNNIFQNSQLAISYSPDDDSSSTNELVIENNQFISNKQSIYVASHHFFDLKNNTFSNSTSSSYSIQAYFFQLLNDEAFTFYKNSFLDNIQSAQYGGGAGIYVSNKLNNEYGQITILFEECHFENNQALRTGMANGGYNGCGGGLQIGWNEETSNSNLEFQNCQFVDNKAANNGGAIAFHNVGYVLIENCIFTSNKAQSLGYGGALYFHPDFDYSAGHHNGTVCPNITIFNCEFTNNGALVRDQCQCHGIYCQSGQSTTLLYIKKCNFVDNNRGWSIAISEANQTYFSDSTFTCTYGRDSSRSIETRGWTSINNVSFIRNQNTGPTTTLFINSKNIPVEVIDCVFDRCHYGDGDSKTVTVQSSNVLFQTNTFLYNQGDGGRPLNIIQTGHYEIIGNNFINTRSWGAITYASDSSSNEEYIVISNNIFDYCWGTEQSRCLNLQLSSSNIIFSGNIIKNCPAVRTAHLGVITCTNNQLTRFLFDNCSFINNSNANQNGGGCGFIVSNGNSNVDLEYINCLFEKNHVESTAGIGGALQFGYQSQYSNLNVHFNFCNFTENQANSSGGAIAFQIQNDIAITNCYFMKNTAGDSGGALYISPDESGRISGSVTLENCEFIENEANNFSALFIPTALSMNVRISNGTFTDNLCKTEQGSAIDLETQSLEVEKSVFEYSSTSNSCRMFSIKTRNLVISSSLFKNCASNYEDSGNAIILSSSVLSALISADFENCGNNKGSVIETYAQEFSLNGTTIQFQEDLPSARGIIIQYGCLFSLFQSTFKSCRLEAASSGGAFEYKGESNYGYNEDIRIENCTFDANNNTYAACFKLTATSVPFLKNIYIKNHIGRSGNNGFFVVIFFSQTLKEEVTFEDVIFENNYFINQGTGTLDCGGCGLWVAPLKTNVQFRDSWPLTFKHCSWIGNRADRGAGAFAYGFSNTLQYIYLNFTECLFENNICDNETGGALNFNSSVPVLISDCIFRGNEAKSGNHSGNAIYVGPRSTVLINHSQFYDNGPATNTGSVIHLSGNGVELANCEISYENSYGCRGIFMDYPGSLSVYNSTFQKCSANTGRGGAIYMETSISSILEEEITIEGCTFEDNAASNGCSILLSTQSVPILNDCTFRNQHTGNYVLCIFFTRYQDSCIVENCKFIDLESNSNRSGYDNGEDSGGSGIWIANQEKISNGRQAYLTFNNCLWENCVSPNRGGAFHYGNSKTLQSIELTFDNCVFRNNQAAKAGGAVSLVTESPILFNICSFISNSVSEIDGKSQGSSIYVSSLTPLVAIYASTFINESAKEGNAIFIERTVPACFISGCNFQNCGTSGTVIVIESFENIIESSNILFDDVNQAARGLEIKTISVSSVRHCSFIRCNSPGSEKYQWGGGIYINNSIQTEEQEELSIEYCRFDACSSNNGCAMVLNISSNPTIRETIFENHKDNQYILCIFGTIYFQDSFVIEKCSFVNNQFSSDAIDGGGSGIWIANDQFLMPGTPTKLTFEGCIWESNTGLYGGAFALGKSATVNSTELSFENCIFENNKASGGKGGALYLFTSQPVNFEGCNFTNNSASDSGTGDGGSIWIDNDAVARISNCFFTGSKASSGNALYLSSNLLNVEIVDSQFLSNGESGTQIVHNGQEIHISNTNISSGSNQLRGVEIRSTSKSYFTHCNFVECKTDGNGGGLYIHGPTDEDNVEIVTIDNCLFDSCDATTGSALLCELSCNPTISSCTLKNMKSGNYNFVIFFNIIQDYVTLSSCTFQDLYYHNSNTGDSGPDSGGSGIWIAPQRYILNGTTIRLVFDQCNFINNLANYVGGALSYGAGRTLNNTFIQFNNCLFEGNTCNGDKGGALYICTNSSLIISQCTFRNNSVNGNNGQGGDIYINSELSSESGDIVDILDSTFESKTVNQGNAIYAGSSTEILNIFGCTFNECGTSGEVLNSNAHEFQISTCSINFSKKESGKSARGLNIPTKSIVTISQITFLNCHTTGDGGCLNCDFSSGEGNESLTIVDCIFDGGAASNGCALKLYLNSAPTLQRNTIRNCNNSNYAVTIFYKVLVEYTTIESCTFEYNTLGSKSTNDGGGAGIWIAPDKYIADDDLKYIVFNQCTFSHNHAAAGGGAFGYGSSNTLKNINLKFEKCTFYDNKADQQGGALYIVTLQPVSILNCLFDSNSANSAGAIYLGTSSNITIKETTIARNTGSSSSSGVYIANENTVNIFNCTFSGNNPLLLSEFSASLTINNEENGFVNISSSHFDFTREPDQIQILITGSSSSATVHFESGNCFTHQGSSDSSLTHIKSLSAGLLSIKNGNCFDVSQSVALSHSSGQLEIESSSVFSCQDCDAIYIPTIAPDPTSRPSYTTIPTDFMTTQSILPTSQSSTIPINPSTTTTSTDEDDSDNDNQNTNKSNNKTGMIIGIVIAIIILIIAIILIIWFLIFRKRFHEDNNHNPQKAEMNDETFPGMTGLDNTTDDSVWNGTTKTQDNPLFFTGEDDFAVHEDFMNNFEENWGENFI